VWRALYGHGTYLKVGWRHNKRRDNPCDVVRVEMKSRTDLIAFSMRVDEALWLAAGLCKTLGHEALGGRVLFSDGERYRKAATTRK